MKSQHSNKTMISFVLPAFIFYTIFMIIPILGGAYYSITDWDGLSKEFNIIGFSNYMKIFQDEYFVNSIWFTFKYTLGVVLCTNVLAIALALGVDRMKKSKGFFRTIFFMPNMVSLLISSFVWVFIFSKIIPEFATNNNIQFLNRSWLGTSTNSFWAILIVSVWAWVGYLMLIYTAGIQSVPKELVEAGKIDGANGWQAFYNITLPLIRTSVTICTFIALNWGFKAFEVMYALTGGGPGKSTESMAMNIYYEAFSGKLAYAYANAKAMTLVVIMLVVAGTQVVVMKRKEVEL
ncbi:MAG: sugar ABC transporter permease [Eubacteriales bacterium]